jgi:branched-chain amino acid transport system permease protein
LRIRAASFLSDSPISSQGLICFVICSALAGLSGVLYTSWGQFITPSSVGLLAAILHVVWVAFSGRSDLTATMLVYRR